MIWLLMLWLIPQTLQIFHNCYGYVSVLNNVRQLLTSFPFGLQSGMWKRKQKLEAEGMEAEGRKIHRFRFHIGEKNEERKEIGSAILQRRMNGGA